MAIITVRRKGVAHEIIIDDEDHMELSQYSWTLDNYGYARRAVKADTACGISSVKMHRQIMSCTRDDGADIDHINGDRLDNRKVNLRRTTRSENMQNSAGHRDRQSTERGVSFHKSTGRWIAQHMNNGETWSSLFDTEQEAINAVRARRAEVLGYEHTLAEIQPPLRRALPHVEEDVERPLLSAAQVLSIRERVAAGESIASVARDVGRGTASIAGIVHGDRYKNCGGPITPPRPKRAPPSADDGRELLAA